MPALDENNDSSSAVLPSEVEDDVASMTVRRMLCTKSFNRLIELLRDPDRSREFGSYISAVAVDGQFERFKLWEANLRDVQHAFSPPSKCEKARFGRFFTMLLRELNRYLTECISLVSAKPPQQLSPPTEAVEEERREKFDHVSLPSDSEDNTADEEIPTSEPPQQLSPLTEPVEEEPREEFYHVSLPSDSEDNTGDEEFPISEHLRLLSLGIADIVKRLLRVSEDQYRIISLLE